MTDVLIEHAIAGHKPGEIVPLTDRLQKHVDAGNARILPSAHAVWDTPNPATEHPQALNVAGTGNVTEDEPKHEDDDDPYGD